MKRVVVVVEGQTELSFVNSVLAEALWPHQVYLTPILLGHTGGRPNYARVKKDVLLYLKQETGAYCSTMIDLYGLGAGFPGTPVPPHLSNIEKVTHIEQAMKADICAIIPDLRPDLRFLPYLQLHEYEGLLFSDPATFATAMNQPDLAATFQRVRDAFLTPEDINDDAINAPSKRVLRAYPSYNKVDQGTIAAQRIGLEAMRRECPHFHEWIARLEAL